MDYAGVGERPIPNQCSGWLAAERVRPPERRGQPIRSLSLLTDGGSAGTDARRGQRNGAPLPVTNTLAAARRSDGPLRQAADREVHMTRLVPTHNAAPERVRRSSAEPIPPTIPAAPA